MKPNDEIKKAPSDSYAFPFASVQLNAHNVRIYPITVDINYREINVTRDLCICLSESSLIDTSDKSHVIAAISEKP